MITHESIVLNWRLAALLFVLMGSPAVSAQETEPEETEPEEPEPEEPEPEGADPDYSGEKDSSEETFDSVFTLYTNLAGWALNGQTLCFEYGKKYSISVRLRFLNASWLNQNLFSKNEDTKFSPGFGLAGRRYFRRKGGTLRGYYLGLAVEHHIFRAAQVEFDWTGGALVLSAETGYRWIVGHFLIGLGVGIGRGFKIYERTEYWFGYTTDEQYQGITPEGVVLDGNLEIGGVF